MANDETVRLNNLVKEIIDDAECHYGMKHIALRKSLFYTGYGPIGCPKIKPERGMENNLYLTISYRNHDVTDMYDNVWIVIVECGICRWEKIATINHNSPYYDKEMSQAEAYARMRQICDIYSVTTNDDKAKLFNLIKNDARIVYSDREDIMWPHIKCDATTLGFFYVIKGIGVFITSSVQDRDWIVYKWILCVDLGLTNITVEELNEKHDNWILTNNNLDHLTIHNRLKQTQSINITQNISGNGNNIVGISMTQRAKDDCDQTQSVVIRNSKSKKKKKDTIIGIFHQSLINLAKILEKASKYLLDHFMDMDD